MHFKPFYAILDHVFLGVTLREKKILKIFHTFCRRGGSDLVWKIPHLFFLKGFLTFCLLDFAFPTTSDSFCWSYFSVCNMTASYNIT